MKVFFDYEVGNLNDETIEHLRQFAIGVMDAMRKMDPSTNYCWNVCRISFDDIQPHFEYGGEWSDLDSVSEGPSIGVDHPNHIAEPPKRKPRAKKNKKTNRKGTRNG